MQHSSFAAGFLAAVVALVSAGAASSAHASLSGRDLDGNLATVEAVHDSATGLTWLADLHASPRTSWAQASAWASSLTIGPTGGWRLSAEAEFRSLYSAWWTATDPATKFDCTFAGSSDCAGSTSGLGSPLFANFTLPERRGLMLWFSDTPYTQAEFETYLPFGEPYVHGQWGDLPYFGGYDPTGDDYTSPVELATHAPLRGLAVIQGDVGTAIGAVPAVPEPATWGLMLAGIVAVGAVSKSRRRAG